MLSRKQIGDLLETLASASIVGVGLAMGGTLGFTVLTGVGIGLSANILQNRCKGLKERWVTSGAFNHDIQQALSRAVIKALDHLETRYFELPQANLPGDKQPRLKTLFAELKKSARTDFAHRINPAMVEEIEGLLYGETHQAEEVVWGYINRTFSTYEPHFRNFLRDNLLDEVVYWFGEELKTDNKESNKAWRAFQRLLLEGLQADVKVVQANLEEIRRDLGILKEIEKRLDKLQHLIEHRTADEPFQFLGDELGPTEPEDGLPSICLHVVDGQPPIQGRKCRFQQSQIKIGRIRSHDLVFPHDKKVSRSHAEISFEKDGYWLKDLDTINGTFIVPAEGTKGDPKRLQAYTPFRLESSMRFRLGTVVEIEFVLDE